MSPRPTTAAAILAVLAFAGWATIYCDSGHVYAMPEIVVRFIRKQIAVLAMRRRRPEQPPSSYG